MLYRLLFICSICVLLLTNCALHAISEEDRYVTLKIISIPEHDGMIFKQALIDALSGHLSSGAHVVLLRTTLEMSNTPIVNQSGTTVDLLTNIEAKFELIPENTAYKTIHFSLSYLCNTIGNKYSYANFYGQQVEREKCLKMLAYNTCDRIIELVHENYS